MFTGDAEAAADRMRGGRLGGSGVLQELLVAVRTMVDSQHLEYAFGERSCLVENRDACSSKSFHKMGAFDENTGTSGSADPGEEG